MTCAQSKVVPMLTPRRSNVIHITYKGSVPTSPRTELRFHYGDQLVKAVQTEKHVYYTNHTERKSMLRGQNVDFQRWILEGPAYTY